MEIWTALKLNNENGESALIFDVNNRQTGETRQEIRYIKDLPIMFELGGYPAIMSTVMLMQPLPWRFQKHSNGHIYIEDESHPI